MFLVWRKFNINFIKEKWWMSNWFGISRKSDLLGGDYMIPISRDEIQSRFAGIPAVL